MRRGSVCSAYTPRIRYARWCRAPMMRPHIMSHAHTRRTRSPQGGGAALLVVFAILAQYSKKLLKPIQAV